MFRDTPPVILAGMALLPAGILLSGMASSLGHRLHRVNRELLVTQQRLRQVQTLIASQPHVERRARGYATFWSEGSDESVQRAFLDELEQFAREGNLSLNLKPRPIQREGEVRRLSVELELEATQGGLLAFLDRLFRQPSPLALERLRIAPSASSDLPLKATLIVNKAIIP